MQRAYDFLKHFVSIEMIRFDAEEKSTSLNANTLNNYHFHDDYNFKINKQPLTLNDDNTFIYNNETYIAFRIPLFSRLHQPSTLQNGFQIRYSDFDLCTWLPAIIPLKQAVEHIQTVVNLKSNVFRIVNSKGQPIINIPEYAPNKTIAEELNALRTKLMTKLEETVITDEEIAKKIEIAKQSIRVIPDIPDTDLNNMFAASASIPYVYNHAVPAMIEKLSNPTIASVSNVLTGILFYTTQMCNYVLIDSHKQAYYNQSNTCYDNIMNALIRINIIIDTQWSTNLSDTSHFTKTEVLTHLTICLVVDLVTFRHFEHCYVQRQLPLAVDQIERAYQIEPNLKYIRSPEDIGKYITSPEQYNALSTLNYGNNPSQNILPYILTLNFPQRQRIMYLMDANLGGLKNIPLFANLTSAEGRAIKSTDVLKIIDSLAEQLLPIRDPERIKLESKIWGNMPEMGGLYTLNSLTGSNLDNILNIFKVQIEQTVNNQGYEEDKRNLQTFMDQYMNKTQENMEE